MKNSFRLFTILGIPIEINISWFIILGLVIFTLAQGYFPFQLPSMPSYIYWIMAVLTALLLFTCLLLHELSHSYVARLNNLPISGITLFVFGGVAHMEKEPNSPKVEFLMALAGPLMSVFLALIFFSISKIALFLIYFPAIYIIADYLAFINIAVAVFNLVPGFPLDGGRILRALIWHFSKNLTFATRIASNFGKAFAFTLMGLGLINLVRGSFISGLWLIFIGLFLLEAAEVSYRQLIAKKMLKGVKVKNIMAQNIITVPPDITLDRLIDDYFFKYRHSIFPVMEDDTILGIVTFHGIKETPKAEWADTKAKDVMINLKNDFFVNKDLDATHALYKLASNGINRALVIESGKLIGILSQKDLMRLFELKSEIEA